MPAKKSSRAKKADKAIVFRNNKGHQIRLSPRMTLRELVLLGVTNIHVRPKSEPLPDGVYANE